MRDQIFKADALDWLLSPIGRETMFDLIATDPPYAFSGKGAEHEMTATVAVVLRESAKRLKPRRWMLVMCASSWRSTAYTVEALRGVLTPVRVGTWCKPTAKTKTRTTGWLWASVNIIAFRNGKSGNDYEPASFLDHITAEPIIKGRRAELPPEVCDWMVNPFAVYNGLMFDPFAGSGRLLQAAERAGMTPIGIEMETEP